MRSLLTVLTALLIGAVVFAAPVQAQQSPKRPLPQKVKQPRAFKKHYRERQARRTQTRPRAMKMNVRSTQPRFYNTNAASRYAKRLKRGAHSRTRANVSPRRITRTTNSAQATVKRIKRAQRRQIRRSSARPPRPTPTFWK